MRVEAVLHPNVAWDLKHRFTRAEVDEFYEQLHLVRRGPLRHSEPITEPAKSRYMLRFFRFGKGIEKIAVFEYDIARSCITVLKCRLSRPRRMRKPNGNNGGKGARGRGSRGRRR